MTTKIKSSYTEKIRFCVYFCIINSMLMNQGDFYPANISGIAGVKRFSRRNDPNWNLLIVSVKIRPDCSFLIFKLKAIYFPPDCF